jgi:hypothetical protein
MAVDRSFGRRIQGPTVRLAAYAHAALYAGLPGSERRAVLLRRAFCEPGQVARELGIEGPVADVRVRSWSALAADEPTGQLEVVCRP